MKLLLLDCGEITKLRKGQLVSTLLRGEGQGSRQHFQFPWEEGARVSDPPQGLWGGSNALGIWALKGEKN